MGSLEIAKLVCTKAVSFDVKMASLICDLSNVLRTINLIMIFQKKQMIGLRVVLVEEKIQTHVYSTDYLDKSIPRTPTGINIGSYFKKKKVIILVSVHAFHDAANASISIL